MVAIHSVRVGAQRGGWRLLEFQHILESIMVSVILASLPYLAVAFAYLLNPAIH
jgi:hypothetical protein